MPFRRTTALSISFDEPIDPERFRFQLPAGEEFQTASGRRRPIESITLVEAQQRAPFTVLMPDRIPESWQIRSRFIGASRRPLSPATVVISYRSADGHEGISIHEQSADPANPYLGKARDDENWEDLTRDGTRLKARPSSWGQAQVLLEREGTHVYLISDTLTRDQVVGIAVSLRPTPSTSSV